MFHFLPTVATLPIERILSNSDPRGTQSIPVGSPMRSLLALRFSGTAWHTRLNDARCWM